MSRTRAEIQKDINILKANIAGIDASLNGPTWANSKNDYRYLDMQKTRNERAAKLEALEKELKEAKDKGEKGRTVAEIEEEIAKTQANLNTYQSILSKEPPNSPSRFLSETFARDLQNKIIQLREELKEAQEEE